MPMLQHHPHKIHCRPASHEATVLLSPETDCRNSYKSGVPKTTLVNDVRSDKINYGSINASKNASHVQRGRSFPPQLDAVPGWTAIFHLETEWNTAAAVMAGVLTTLQDDNDTGDDTENITKPITIVSIINMKKKQFEMSTFASASFSSLRSQARPLATNGGRSGNLNSGTRSKMQTFIFFLVIFFLLFAPATSDFVEKNNGNCADVGWPVLDAEGCKDGAVVLGLVVDKIPVYDPFISSNIPPGCYFKPNNNVGSQLFLLHANCTGPCTTDRTCVCWIGASPWDRPACVENTGLAANPSTCVCGNAICSNTFVHVCTHIQMH